VKRVVVIGGRGYLGSKAVRALRAAEGVEVAVAGRAGPVRVDLARPETFEALVGFDVVVDASSSHAVSPAALARFCLERGLVLLEASSDRTAVEPLLEAHRGVDAPGAVVLGAGIFTGLSNLVAAEALRRLPGATSLSLAVSSSPFSGAGDATVALMSDALRVPTRSYRGGLAIDGPSVGPGPEVEFPGGARRPTLHVPFPEPAMLHASTGVPEVVMYFAPRPAFLRTAFLATPLSVVQSAAFGVYLRTVFGALRSVFLEDVPCEVELVARASRRDEHVDVGLVAADGMEAGGVAVAALALALLERRPRGLAMIDEVVSLEAALATMQRLAPEVSVRRALPR